MANDKRKKAALRLRDAIKALESEIAAVKRELDEADEADETPTVRPPSQTNMEAVKIEIVKLPHPRRPR
jgi:hypothetical protein